MTIDEQTLERAKKMHADFLERYDGNVEKAVLQACSNATMFIAKTSTQIEHEVCMERGPDRDHVLMGICLKIAEASKI